MSRIRTLNDLQDYLDKDFSWRLKELADVKSIVRESEQTRQKTAIRSAICLAYAHWEGFVKKSAEVYIKYVSNQRLTYEELSHCFLVIGAKRHIQNLSNTGSPKHAVQTVEFFRNELSNRAFLSIPKPVNTRSNLSSVVFEEIAVAIGVDPTGFSSRYNQIDTELLKRRNRIAHGEYLELDAAPCRTIIDDTIALLRQFKNEIENAASCEVFKL